MEHPQRECRKVVGVEEMVNTVVTQAPNFIFAGIAVFALWRALVASEKRNEAMIERLIQMTKDCDCDKAEPQAAQIVKRDTGEY